MIRIAAVAFILAASIPFGHSQELDRKIRETDRAIVAMAGVIKGMIQAQRDSYCKDSVDKNGCTEDHDLLLYPLEALLGRYAQAQKDDPQNSEIQDHIEEELDQLQWDTPDELWELRIKYNTRKS
jgi:hypothetical protein